MKAGPEMLNKYVGESEKNIRELFEPSKKKPDEFHIIIIDELECIMPRRGSGHNSIGDSMVNSFLAEMDGLNSLNNFLVIGLTNRLDLIDKAILRPGRFEL